MYNLVLVGDRGVGKTTFVQRFITGESEGSYVSIRLFFYDGPITFNVWDIAAGQEWNGTLPNGNSVHCGIILFDLSSSIAYDSVPTWHGDLTRVCEHIPIAVVGNKFDQVIEDLGHRTFHRNIDVHCCISCTFNISVELPFLWLARQLTGDDDLCFVHPPGLRAPELIIGEPDRIRLRTEMIALALRPDGDSD